MAKLIYYDRKFNGNVFNHNGITYKPHTDLKLNQSAFYRLDLKQKFLIFIFSALLTFGILIDWHNTFIIFIAILTSIYFTDLLFNLIIIGRSFTNPKHISISRPELLNINDKNLPIYTILCPLYKESNILSQFITAMKRLDYPKNKLQILLLMEEDDKFTQKAAANLHLPSYFQIITIPQALPKTKPKALNYGLRLTLGKFVTIYDAEDIPEPQQLKKAVLAFNKNDQKIVCLQAKLNFYNPHQNLITRLFTAEYALWFNLVLIGIDSLSAPMPLAGTSNHFRTNILKKISGWDSFNVTEDCDLGIRLSKLGYSAALIDSETQEEANSEMFNWFNQRSRWVKGYIQTYFVHNRNISEFWKNSQNSNALLFQIIVGGKIMSLFINPLMWILTLIYFSMRSRYGFFIESFFPAPVFYMAAFSLIIGNFLYMYYYMIACAKRGYEELIKFVYFVPLYWLGMSIAAWKAMVEFINSPFHWSKTVHGLHITVNVPVEIGIRSRIGWGKYIFSFASTFSIKRIRLRIDRISVSIVSITSSIISCFIILNRNLNSDMFFVLNRMLWIYIVSVIITNFVKRNGLYILMNLLDGISLFNPMLGSDINKNNGKRILIYNWRDIRHTNAGGAEVYIHELAKRWIIKEYSVTIFTGNDGNSPRNETLDGIKIVRRGGFYTVYIWAFLYYLFQFRGKYDLVIDSQNGLPFFTPIFVRKPIICLIHHIHKDVFYKSLFKFQAVIASYIEVKLMPVFYHKTRFITVSESTKKEMEKIGLVGSGVEIVHPGVDLEQLKPGIKDTKPLVIYLGRLKFYKSINVLLKAAYYILQQIPDARFEIAGDGEERKILQELTKELNLTRQVKFLGKITEKEKI